MAGDVDALLDEVDAQLDELTDRVVECFRAEITTYASIPDADLRPGVRSNIERALLALHRGWEPAVEEIVSARALGAHRARQGLPLDALLQAHRIGVREALALVRVRAEARQVSAEVVLELATRAWAWADAVMLAAAAGHRELEVDLAAQEQQRRAHLLRGLLRGGLGEAGLRTGVTAYGIGLADDYVPWCADGAVEALRKLERAIVDVAAGHRATVLQGHLDSGLAGILGPVTTPDGARAIMDTATASLVGEVLVAMGPPAPPTGLIGPFTLAEQARTAARALCRTGVVELADVALHAGVLAQAEIGTLLEGRLLAPLDSEGDFGVELLTTLEGWFAHGMRTEQTAAALVVHPNTLRHRLHRVEELTGLSLDVATDRFALWWALTWRRLGGGPPHA